MTANNDPLGLTAKKAPEFYMPDYFGSGFDTGARAKRITELLDARRGSASLGDMQRIQFDHKDLFAMRMVGLLRIAAERFGNRLVLSQQARSLMTELLQWDGEALRDRHQPIVFETWMITLAREYFKEIKDTLGKDNIESLSATPVVGKTLYYRLSEGLAANDPTLPLQWIQASLEEAAPEVARKPQRWGAVNTIRFRNLLEGILPQLASLPIERDGSWQTVDVAGGSFTAYGPNFRLILELEEGKPIRGVNILAGGNYNDALDNGGWRQELMMWRDGKYRDLVEFAN